MIPYLIDHIYESALVPEKWLNTLEEINCASGSGSGSLFAFSNRFNPRGISTDMTSDLLDGFLNSDTWRNSPSVRWTLDTRPTSFLSVDDHIDQHISAMDEVWKPLAARGFAQRLALVVPISGGDQVAFVLARLQKNGRYRANDVTMLDGLRPHLSRAVLIAARLGLERANAAAETLARLGLAAAVIDLKGRVISANSLLNTLDGVFVTTAFGGIAVRDKGNNALIQNGLGMMRGANGTGTSIPIPAAADGAHPAMIIHLLPVRGAGNDIFTGGHALIVVSPIQGAIDPLPEMLHGLFDLSAAEARLVGELASGQTLREITTLRNVSMATLRTQVRAILSKTGVRRLADLHQLLAQLPHQSK